MALERFSLPSRSRRDREHEPRYIIIHATRGPAASSGHPARLQYEATKNWFKQGGVISPAADWGPSADILIGHDGRECFFTDLRDRDFHATRANWSAGFGGSSHITYGADEYGISIEVAQSADLESFTDEALDTLIGRCAYLCLKFNIDPVRIPYLSQVRAHPVPSGLVGHEDTANGRKTGKSDPGERFPWAWFIQALRAEIARRSGTEAAPQLDIQAVTTLTDKALAEAENAEQAAVTAQMHVAELRKLLGVE